MKSRLLLAFLVIGCTLAGATVTIAALNGGSLFTIRRAGKSTSSEDLPRFSNPTAINNNYLPLGKLKIDILEGSEGGKPLRVERSVKPGRKVFTIGGQSVEALIMEDRETIKGDLEEIALDYFAQSDDGTVYYLGEDVDNYKKGKVVGHEGAWLYGKQTQTLGVILPGDPKVGQKFKAEDVPKLTWEKDEVVSTSEKITVPAGTYENCVKVKETNSDGETEYKWYAPGIGVVQESVGNESVVLKSHQTS